MAFASRLLNSSEQTYSQIEKSLAKNFVLSTDQKPLLTIVGSEKKDWRYMPQINKQHPWASILLLVLRFSIRNLT